uniref:NADH dehydrogenase subunit 6 n=1 Tax=Acrolepiopsis assectella TaxID=57686 RepID=UPI0020368CD6|nr:NADH dehydrogenase subunit 6 [Acrolepiopsis assectella]UQV94873.1 NADH dehydrogenase subunit 6 [Acrolepiopsis assectella]
MKFFLSFMIMMFSIFMYFLNHPLSMGLMILIQTLLICLMSGMMINSYWFSYILFLTFLGGLLVLFIYVSSIASNEMFLYSNNIMMLMIFLTFIIIMYSYNFNNMKWMNLFFNEEMNQFFNNFMFMNNEEKLNLTKLYNNQTFLLTMMMIIYLFITLLAIVKITNIFYGPIRSNKF